MSSDLSRATHLLARLRDGEAEAGDALIPIVYAELRGIADSLMRKERDGHTLQATALVNEAWIRVMRQPGAQWADRPHFLRTAARAMRHVLVDHARRRAAQKRGAAGSHETLDESVAALELHPGDLLEIHELLAKLGAKDAQLVRVVELRFFAGLTIEETGDALGLSVRQVQRAWSFARAWLERELRATSRDDD